MAVPFSSSAVSLEIQPAEAVVVETVRFRAGRYRLEGGLAYPEEVFPTGAAVLAGTTVALLVIGYLAIYLLIFLPRGAVG